MSKRLVELQGVGDERFRAGWVYYTNQMAPVFPRNGIPGSEDSCTVLVGEANDEACRRWQAVLAKGQGYKAEVVANAKGAFLALFSIDVKDEFIIGRNRGRGTPMQPFHPPSAVQAIDFLRRFCEYHHATTESATAMSIAFMVRVETTTDITLDWHFLETTHPQTQTKGPPKLADQFTSFKAHPPPAT